MENDRRGTAAENLAVAAKLRFDGDWPYQKEAKTLLADNFNFASQNAYGHWERHNNPIKGTSKFRSGLNIFKKILHIP